MVIKNQSVMPAVNDVTNPLSMAYSHFKIDYNSGGFFHLKHVRLSAESDQFVDYKILIDTISDTSIVPLLKSLDHNSKLMT